MLREATLLKKLKTVFEPPQAAVLAQTIVEAYTDVVNTSDFNELTAVVKRIAEAQERTDRKMGELAEAQKRTDQKMAEMAQSIKSLADAQERLANAQERLTDALSETRSEVGGLSRGMSYALENEAYRLLPQFLRQQHGIEMAERLIRKEIGGEEINFFGKAMYQGNAVLLVGETKLRLDERRESRQAEQKILETLHRKIDAVKAEYPQETILALLVTHYARPTFVKKVRTQGIVLVQSFEW